jgi:hypothetical protein
MLLVLLLLALVLMLLAAAPAQVVPALTQSTSIINTNMGTPQ